MKIKFLAIFILCSLFFVGCVSTKNVPVADSDIDDFRNHTVSVPKREVPDFAASTAGKASFGVFGAAAMISEGNKIIEENKVEDNNQARIAISNFNIIITINFVIK